MSQVKQHDFTRLCPRLGRIHKQVLGEENARVCKDTPESACQRQRSLGLCGSEQTVLGVIVLPGGSVGIIADLLSFGAVLELLGVLSLLAAVYIARLRDVSG